MLFHQVVISHFKIATFSIFHYERCTFASFPMLHDMRWQGDGCYSLFIRKGSTGLVAFKRSVPLGLSGKSPHLRVVFSAKTLCKFAPLPLFCYKKESAYSDLWTHKKNVAMDKQKVNTTSSMNRKGYSSSYDCSRNSTNTSKPCSYRRINLCSQCRTRYARYEYTG